MLQAATCSIIDRADLSNGRLEVVSLLMEIEASRSGGNVVVQV
jgi:hypothetical protein